MGVDVSLTRGLDLVMFDASGELTYGPEKCTPVELAAILEATRPDVVAVDAPPSWAPSGRSRAVERSLMALGISIYATPADPRGRPFYGWMEGGFKVFAAAAAQGYPEYTGGATRRRRAIEVFPHASAVTLLGGLPSSGSPKHEFRRRALESEGIRCRSFKTPDQIDAALAALTGMRFVQGNSCHLGVEGESVLVLPVPRLSSTRYRREPPH